MKNPYTVLGVKKDASYQEIKKAYRTLSKKVHPDVDQDNENSTDDFLELNKAWEILNDDIKRKLYDERGRVEDSSNKQSIYNEIHTHFINNIILHKDYNHNSDIIKIIIENIDKVILEAENKKPQLLKTIENLKLYKGKVKPKDKNEEDNPFDDLIDGRIIMVEGEMDWWEKLPIRLRSVKAVVNQFECTNNKRSAASLWGMGSENKITRR